MFQNITLAALPHPSHSSSPESAIALDSHHCPSTKPWGFCSTSKLSEKNLSPLCFSSLEACARWSAAEELQDGCCSHPTRKQCRRLPFLLLDGALKPANPADQRVWDLLLTYSDTKAERFCNNIFLKGVPTSVSGQQQAWEKHQKVLIFMEGILVREKWTMVWNISNEAWTWELFYLQAFAASHVLHMYKTCHCSLTTTCCKTSILFSRLLDINKKWSLLQIREADIVGIWTQ